MALYGGIELHANNSVVVLLNEQDQVIYQRRFANHLPTGLDHGVGHFRSLSITQQRHWLTYHFIAARQEGLCQVF